MIIKVEAANPKKAASKTKSKTAKKKDDDDDDDIFIIIYFSIFHDKFILFIFSFIPMYDILIIIYFD